MVYYEADKKRGHYLRTIRLLALSQRELSLPWVHSLLKCTLNSKIGPSIRYAF
jgi:hypothetical protein